MVRVIFRPHNKQRQHQKRQVQTNLNSKQTPNVNRPASHNANGDSAPANSAATVILHVSM